MEDCTSTTGKKTTTENLSSWLFVGFILANRVVLGILGMCCVCMEACGKRMPECAWDVVVSHISERSVLSASQMAVPVERKRVVCLSVGCLVCVWDAHNVGSSTLVVMWGGTRWMWLFFFLSGGCWGYIHSAAGAHSGCCLTHTNNISSAAI